MLKELLRYDSTNMLLSSVGRKGTNPRHLQQRTRDLEHARKKVNIEWKKNVQGWLGCPDDLQLVRHIQGLAQEKQKKYTTCLVIGIGGSDLGARAGYAALGTQKNKMRLEFAGGNTDPDELTHLLSRLDLKRTIVNIISKSGGTIEPMSAFFVVRDLLKHSFGQKMADHIVATTDEHQGALRDLAQKEGYKTLPIPRNIGGRFSVLTAVGLFPFACAGIDIKKMLDGAKTIRTSFVKNKKDDASDFALLQFLADTEHGQHIHILMPYSGRLKQFSRWYRQIWAESLGKRLNKDGDLVYSGPTPIAALGATDQHSQLQLYVEGPNDKTITFIEVERFDTKLRVPHGAQEIPSLAYLAGVSFEKIIHSERKGTAESLRRAYRPNGTISIPKISAETLGALFMFFEISVSVAGELYGINAYDQPGVEEGKHVTAELLGKQTQS